jgi:hypothetical protein
MAERFSERAVVIGQWLAVLATLALVLLSMLWQ